MCGFVGTVGDVDGPVGDPIGAALTVLARRGPDGGARKEGRLGSRPAHLGSRRLSLVEREAGVQPIERPSGALLAWNGEIYNHAALRESLRKAGVVFLTGGDGEVLAALLEHEGVAGLGRVEGCYAFAFLAGDGSTLQLGRDPAGIRPLVYVRTADGLAFASTLDALRATGAVRAQPDMDAIVDVLRDGVIPSSRTALLDVVRIAPGEVLCFDATLNLNTREVPQPKRSAPREEPEFPDVLQALRAATRDRMAVDRPAALLLSGGIDSALLAALVAESDAPLPAFTLG